MKKQFLPSALSRNREQKVWSQPCHPGCQREPVGGQSCHPPKGRQGSHCFPALNSHCLSTCHQSRASFPGSAYTSDPPNPQQPGLMPDSPTWVGIYPLALCCWITQHPNHSQFHCFHAFYFADSCSQYLICMADLLLKNHRHFFWCYMY